MADCGRLQEEGQAVGRGGWLYRKRLLKANGKEDFCTEATAGAQAFNHNQKALSISQTKEEGLISFRRRKQTESHGI